MPNASVRTSRNFLDELVARLRFIRLDAIPDIVAAIDRAVVAEPAHTGGIQRPLDLDALARVVVALPVAGSRLGAVEAAVVRNALETCKGNVSAAARLLGVERKAFVRRVARYRRRATR